MPTRFVNRARGADALALVWLIGLYAVVFGIGMLALALRLRELLKHMPAVSSPVAQASRA